MFGIGSMELLVIVLVAVIVLGPEHLPRIMRTVNKAMSEVRRVSTEFQRTLNAEAHLEELEKKKRDLEQAIMSPISKKKSPATPKPQENAEPEITKATTEPDATEIIQAESPAGTEVARDLSGQTTATDSTPLAENMHDTESVKTIANGTGSETQPHEYKVVSSSNENTATAAEKAGSV